MPPAVTVRFRHYLLQKCGSACCSEASSNQVRNCFTPTSSSLNTFMILLFLVIAFTRLNLTWKSEGVNNFLGLIPIFAVIALCDKSVWISTVTNYNWWLYQYQKIQIITQEMVVEKQIFFVKSIIKRKRRNVLEFFPVM